MCAVYLDCNATTPIYPRVAEVVSRFLLSDYGNAGSRTHGFGSEASKGVEDARRHIASLAGVNLDEVVFTSGATEANNLAILGLADYGLRTGRTHLITTAVEHKAVLEPFEYLAKVKGFEFTILPANSGGWPSPGLLAESLRPETLLISTMHVNN